MPGPADFTLQTANGRAAWEGLLAGNELAGFEAVHVARQVHGTDIGWVEDGAGLVIPGERDGHLTRSPGTLLGVTVADCVPVYLGTGRGEIVGLLHAGWRGVAGGILERAVQMLAEAGVEPGEVVVHCGASICGSCYEVGPEVFSALGLPEPDGPAPVDLRANLLFRARHMGLGQATASRRCTREDSGCHSYRRDGTESGRMAAFIGRKLS